MTKHAHRILFVFAPHLNKENQLQADIRHYQHMMRRTNALGLVSPEYFILVVSPYISATVQCTPEIQAYVSRHTEENFKQLKRIGAALNIPTERQCLAEGNRNFEAWRVAKLLGVNEVYGYGKGFVRLLALWEDLQFKWAQGMKKIVQRWSLHKSALSQSKLRKKHAYTGH